MTQRIQNRLLIVFIGLSCLFGMENIYAKNTLSSRYVNSERMQGTTRTGHVVDTKGEIIIGANIVVKGTTTGTITDVNGNFSMEAPEGSVLLVTYVGYTPKEIVVTKQSTYTITLSEDTQKLEEVIVVGYGTMKRKDLTGSVTRVDAEKYTNQFSTQVTDMLAGTVAGFNVTQSSDAAGGGSIQVRGPTSLKASTSPLIVLDGIIYNGSLKDINPKDIESVDILKDASSAAVYGSQAAAGVMIITTKKGKQGKPVVNVSAQIGVSDLTNTDYRSYKTVERFLKFRQDAQYQLNRTNPNTAGKYKYYYMNPNALPAETNIAEWRNASNHPSADDKAEWGTRLGFAEIEHANFMAGNSIDLFDLTFQTGLKQSYDASISGGTEHSNYYWSLGYDDNSLVQKGNDYKIFRSRLNYDYTIARWLKVGINAQFSDRNESEVPLAYEYRLSPLSSLYKQDGTYEPYPADYTALLNPFMNYTQRDKYTRISTLQAALYAHVTLPFGFKYEITFQPRYQFMKDNIFWGADTWEGSKTYSQGYGQRIQQDDYGYLLDNIIRWNKKFGVHAFDVTLLYNAEMNKTWYSKMTGETFEPNSNLSWHALQQAAKQSVNNNDKESSGNAMMARLNYTFNDRYMLTASVRRDGFSAFGKDNKYGTFPAFAAAWRITEEEFFKVPVINNLKLRVSWGINGNRSIGEYSALAQIKSGSYYTGSGLSSNIFNFTMENNGLVWEKTQSLNVGLDFSLFDSRLNGTIDYYQMTTKDLLMDRKLPLLTGFNTIVANLGELGNTGLEISLNSVNIKNENFQWNSNLVFSLNRNKINKLYGDYGEYTLQGKKWSGELPDYTNGWFPGHAIDAIWDYRVTGIFQMEEEQKAKAYKLGVGHFKSVDFDDSGIYEEKMDKDFIGYQKPQYRIGFGNDFSFLKHWTASIFIRADLGQKARFTQGERQESYSYYRISEYDMPYWTPENRSNDYQGLSVALGGYGGGFKLWKNASFVRIQDVTLAYNLPSKICKTIKMNGVKFFGSIRNLATFTAWPGWDPETLNSPMARTFSFGVSVSL